MPSNYTENYQLNQWEPEDRVLRTDFNTDNAKIDAALTGKLGRSATIRSFITEEKTDEVVVDLSDLNWEDWEAVCISVDRGSKGKTEEAVFSCDLNEGKMDSYCSTYVNHFAYTAANPILIILLPRHDPSLTVQGICIGREGSFGIGTGTFAELTSIRFRYYKPNVLTMSSGVKFAIWGLK